ncbi:uncharacterized protein SPPG_03532 [Spizellomyces punctatus DAOM BR117]|uniref:rRNA biogenesis protein RRP36 n=1 Tax=Spizellomyces punctatus (strain DAOM BR117) TaxID=645134 RepID=A0A0L0HLQ4_SPIPD|nr:uncharacterized protein SPPG_03532 [Spizellomyces punctatus DAOM BR117]KND01739.1 hypothetical protein SPPG_03532 [Spizellomyces punctatus DAOM BR117]|eukprot:XP_016609778.1 hypothetical protein SPPG_03532 [Spizellomyces punctatus DAOM BR117]
MPPSSKFVASRKGSNSASRGRQPHGSGRPSNGLREYAHESEDEDMSRVLRRMQAFDNVEESDNEDDVFEEGEDATSVDIDDPVEQDEGSSSAGDDVDEDEGDGSSYDEAENTSDEDESDGREEDNESDAEEQLMRIKRELADVPFDQLIEIQQKVGLKRFHANYRANRRSTTEDTSDEDGEPADTTSHGNSAKTTKGALKASKHDGKGKKPPKRLNKNAPVEVTSKRAVTRRREVVELPKKKSRDPRFDPLAGKLNDGLFQQSYGFIRDYEQHEVEMLKKRIVTEKDPEVKEQLHKTLTSMQSRLQTQKQKDKRKEILRNWRKTEEDLVKLGKKPWQLKKSDIKKLELVEKYQSMKGKDVDKLLEKRRKKNAAKERRFLPYKRRSAD